jgi:DNA polymerase-3 subunit gamma/tau
MYLALARKYRPQTFKELIGQPHVIRTLQNAISMNKLYPALIFSGMKGVGKTSAARILAKSLNCLKGPAVEPCNECEICTEITGDKSSDYIEIDGASNNGVEEVRTLRETVKYKPIKNRYRVVVIDEVHMLSTSAWNALLKTVEEPPPHTYFVMATTDFHKIPATIVSRCQHFEFKRIPYEIVKTLLKEISEKEKIKISDYALYLIARSADGSLRDAKKILDQSIALSSGNVQDSDVIDILGIIEEEIFMDLTRSILNQNRKEIIEKINALAERGVDLRFFFGEYLKFFRDLIILKSLNESEGLHNLNPENIPELREIIKDVKDVELLRYFNAAKELEMTMKYTENPRIMLEYFFLKLSYFPSLIAIEDIITKIGSGKVNPPPVNFPKGDAPPKVEAVSSQLTKEKEIEGDVSAVQVKNLLLEHIGNHEPRLKAALSGASFFLNGEILLIELSAGQEHLEKVITANRDYLNKQLLNVGNWKFEIDVQVKQVQAKEVKENDDKKAKIAELGKDEKITSLMDTIKGKIVTIEDVKEELKGGNNA